MHRETDKCLKCDHLKDKKVITGFGEWEAYCQKYKIGRSGESESCESYHIAKRKKA